ncbi:hypothetical protein [Actinomadura sp. 3N508]|uniref:hypothetical protein n=1 Tax=Actinomadura sp. 3N508 TaxID=3375153 RepID=UPI0037B7CA35
MPVHRPAMYGAARRATDQRRSLPGARTVPTAATRFNDDDVLLLLLISTWELHAARPAPAIAPADMTEQELIEYWSDSTEDPCPPDCPAPHPPQAPASPPVPEPRSGRSA